jgi:hypothetical protein
MILKNVHIAQGRDISNYYLAGLKHVLAAAVQVNQKNKSVHLEPSQMRGFFLFTALFEKYVGLSLGSVKV